MITSLLGQTVRFDGRFCKIVTVYQNNLTIMVVAADENGELFTRNVGAIKLETAPLFAVLIDWQPNQRVAVIKFITDSDQGKYCHNLADAKQFVGENSPTKIEGLTYDEALIFKAEAIKRKLKVEIKYEGA